MVEDRIQRALVLGDGSWGTALALALVESGLEVTLWSPFPEQVEALQGARENARFLPGVALPEGLAVTADPMRACEGVQLCVSVVPTQFLRRVAERFEDALPGAVPLLSATKGLEIETFKRPTQILGELLGERPICVLSGPSHAEEVARHKPASVVAASSDERLAERVQAAFSVEHLRVYTSGDPEGAEMAGALKNVIAIAAGICDGLKLGDNAKAALLTRGVVEMARFGRAHGAQAESFFGLAGVGDLVVTCWSEHSRNRAVGERIGAGETLESVLGSMSMVAEGVWTTRALFGPESEARKVEMPIAEQVYAVLFEGKSPATAVEDLMQRSPTSEMQGVLPEGV